MILIVAGHETTVGLIGNAALNLLVHPDQLGSCAPTRRFSAARSRRSSGTRAPSSARSIAGRRPTSSSADTRSGAGELVIGILNSAGRDSDRFPQADRFDVTREDTRHLAFGRGSHYCLGAPLARLEAEIALETLFRRLPGLRLALPRDQLEWRATPGFRRLVALPVAW